MVTVGDLTWGGVFAILMAIRQIIFKYLWSFLVCFPLSHFDAP